MSSRKPRLNPKLLVQQVAKQQAQIQQQALKASAAKSSDKCSSSSNKEKSKVTNSSEKRKTIDLEPMSPTSSTSSSTKSVKREKKDKASIENGLNKSKNSNLTFKLKDVDRNNGITKSITVSGVTVVITEFQLKRPLESDQLKKNGKKSVQLNKSKS